MNDPEILALRKKLEKKRLLKAIEEEDATPKLVELAERVAKLEETTKDIEQLKTWEQGQDKTLRTLTDWTNALRRDNERHKNVISNALIAIAMYTQDETLGNFFENMIGKEYGLALNRHMEIERIDKSNKETRQATPP